LNIARAITFSSTIFWWGLVGNYGLKLVTTIKVVFYKILTLE
jgi:hypothetical protein